MILIKKDQKKKVGRPRLADKSLKKKTYVMLGVAFILMVGLILAGVGVLTKVNVASLKGNSCNVVLQYDYKIKKVDPYLSVCDGSNRR